MSNNFARLAYIPILIEFEIVGRSSETQLQLGKN